MLHESMKPKPMMQEAGVPRLLSLFAAAVLSSGCATFAPQTTVRQHPDFASGARTLQTMTVLPAEVEFTRITVSGKEREPETEATLRKRLAEEVGAILEARGFAVNADLLERLDAGDPQLESEYEQFRAAYAQASAELYRQRSLPVEEANKSEAGVGSLANRLAGVGGANALVVVRFQGYGKSQGQVAKETAAPIVLGAIIAATRRGHVEASTQVPPSAGGRIEIAVVDAASGEVLWANVFAADIPPPALARAALSTFPTGGKPPAGPVYIEREDVQRPQQPEAQPAATPQPQAR